MLRLATDNGYYVNQGVVHEAAVLQALSDTRLALLSPLLHSLDDTLLLEECRRVLRLVLQFSPHPQPLPLIFAVFNARRIAVWSAV